MEVFKQMTDDYVLYEISNYGNVRNFQTNKILKQRIDSNGYAIVLLRDKNNIRKWVHVSDLIAYYIYDHVPF
jgi:hypothetical protein